MSGESETDESKQNEQKQTNLSVALKKDVQAESDQLKLTRQSTTKRLQRYLSAQDAAPPIAIEFIDMKADVPTLPGSKETKQILHGVSGKIEAGEFLALMGPSGAGKSTLLNVLGSRFDHDFSGEVLVNGKPRTKQLKRKIGYVLQDEVILPNLTVRETLDITAKLRLPKLMTKLEKMERVDDIIHVMGLNKCENTLVQSVSGGERKRISIANEMLINPSVIFLDEPTSGLDSTTAYSILTTLQELTLKGRTIICAIHQPSSQMFAKFDKLLLMASGKVAYFGKVNLATDYFGECGYPCPIHYNPADFILELVTDNFESEDESLQNKEEIKKHLIECWQNKIDGKPIIQRQFKRKNNEISDNETDENENENENKESPEASKASNSNSNLTNSESKSNTTSNSNSSLTNSESKTNESSLTAQSESTNNNIPNNTNKEEKWPTSWCEQFTILLIRAFKHRKGHIFSIRAAFETISIMVISGALWFRIPTNEIQLQTWIGATFFIQIFLGFSIMYRGVVHFPTEKSVIKRERHSGSYRLTTYYLSKLIAELPVDILLPMLGLTLFYWMVGLADDFGTFILYLIVSCLGIATSNAFGTLLGCSLMNLERAVTSLAVIGIFFMLISGFLVKDRAIPIWISWIKYISFMRYMYVASLLIILKYTKFKCSNPSDFETCDQTNVNYNGYIDSQVLLDYFGTTESLEFCILMLVGQGIIWHCLAYLNLKRNTQ